MLNNFKPFKLKSLLDARKILMKGLIPNAGKFGIGNVSIVKGSKITHVAPHGNIRDEALALTSNRVLWFIVSLKEY